MSAQFGIWNRDGATLAPADRHASALAALGPYGPDAHNLHLDSALAFGFAAFHTTPESRRDRQPLVLSNRLVITWDGRLDNRAELIRELDVNALQEESEVAVVAASYMRWGSECFSRLHGDWALAVWDAKLLLLLLARDYLGTRPLYYRLTSRQLIWSTVIDPLVTDAGHSLTLNREYIEGWLARLPSAHLTPYTEIAAVPPSSYIAVGPTAYRIAQYWDFDPSLNIRYRRDSDYEEHFRESFGRSVQRRLRSDLPVLAHLSGGMDSSSIVCMADHLSAGAAGGPARLETISYFSDEEPNWNERPWFERVEGFRGKTGLHIDVSLARTGSQNRVAGSVPVLPGAARFSAPPELAAWIDRTGCRVLLSGFGGDEVTGGVPTPIPELQNLVARASLMSLARQLHTWALRQKRPWIHLLYEALRDFLPWPMTAPAPGDATPWLLEKVGRHTAAMRRAEQERLKFFGPLPSFRANLEALEGLRRMLSSSAVPVNPLLDRRYPFLDRELLIFLFAIPRDQIVRPGQRRSLMRRALRGIVPDEILDRRRKAYVGRLPIITVEQRLMQYVGRSTETWLSRLGFIDDKRLCACLAEVCRRRQAPALSLFRVTGIEEWIETLGESGIVSVDAAGDLRFDFCGNSCGKAETVSRNEAFHGSR